MKLPTASRLAGLITLSLISLTHPSPVQAQQLLSGDARLACEALLCLSSTTRPSACNPALRRYFSISLRRLSDTVRARKNFLNLCPVNNPTSLPNATPGKRNDVDVPVPEYNRHWFGAQDNDKTSENNGGRSRPLNTPALK